mmetsp:Transcript_4166/g.10684  ORF Transcript_4166/g.10684 Transcript_4166/m.10684 type:complete len:281 (+) Transcript_4166:459-1301(+)
MPSTVGSALAAIPVLGGASLLLGGAASIYTDHVQVKCEEKQRAERVGREPHPVLIRYLSAVIGDPGGWPRHIFLVAVTIFAICLSLTGVLQTQVLAKRNNDCPSTCPPAWPFIVYPNACGIAGITMTLFTHGHAIFQGKERNATAFHLISASCFIGFAVAYGASTVPLAVALEQSVVLRTIRTVFAIGCGIGCFFNVLLVGPAAYGTIRLLQHQAAEDQLTQASTTGTLGLQGEETNLPLTPQQILNVRVFETGLACGQILVGVCVCALTAMGAAEMLLW